MKKLKHIFEGLVSSVLILLLMAISPLEAVAQSSSRSNLLESGSKLILRVNENVKFNDKTENGVFNALVDNDVYSADGSRILIKAGTPASIEYSVDPNGAWGKAGKVCVTSATCKTIDNKRVTLRLNNCKKGGSRLGGVIVISVLLFPLGLLSGFMKGGMPKIAQGTTFNAAVMQDVTVE